MTTIYLVSNNCFMNDLLVYKDYLDLDEKRKIRPLTVNGEKVALTIAKKKILQNADVIYSSSFFSSINTAKYLAEKNNIDIIIDSRIDDRKIGLLEDKNLNLRNMQEHDFDYKLVNGESLNEVKNRVRDLVKELIKNYENGKVIMFTHNSCILALLSIWATKGFNYEERLILEYNDEVLFDGLKTDSDIVGIKFDGDVIKELKNIK